MEQPPKSRSEYARRDILGVSDEIKRRFPVALDSSGDLFRSTSGLFGEYLFVMLCRVAPGVLISARLAVAVVTADIALNQCEVWAKQGVSIFAVQIAAGAALFVVRINFEPDAKPATCTANPIATIDPRVFWCEFMPALAKQPIPRMVRALCNMV